jgi:hypothetical protein
MRQLGPACPEQMMTMVVVFGGSGFLGRRLVHRLTAEGIYASLCGIQTRRGWSSDRSVSTGSRLSPLMWATGQGGFI